MNTRTFILHWRDGKTETVIGQGSTQLLALRNAMMTAGIGTGALPALDYWEERDHDIPYSPVCLSHEE